MHIRCAGKIRTPNGFLLFPMSANDSLIYKLLPGKSLDMMFIYLEITSSPFPQAYSLFT